MNKLISMNLRPQPFQAIKKGTKDFELRLNDEKRQAIGVGDVIQFIHTETQERLYAKVIQKHIFENFSQLYAAFDKRRLGYQADEIARHTDMEKYYSPEEIAKNGVLAIEIKLLKDGEQVRVE